MKRLFVAAGCTLFLLACALLGARGREATVKVRLQLLDGRGEKLGGIVRVIPAEGKKPVELPRLLNRLRGLKKTDTLDGWHVLPSGGGDTSLPKGRYRVEALSGIETVLASVEIDVSGDESNEFHIQLQPIFRPEDDRLVAGNTHLHLQGLTEDECNEYLRQVPAADGIRVMFISYLERVDIDKTYVTNRYPIGDLKAFEATGVLFNNGEEHRHNFEAWGQGYGHVMFLDIQQLVKPVSLGAGITGKGNDDRPLRPGIEDARRQGGAVIWCHNNLGHEDVPTALAGRLDALNVFDGSRGGKYEDTYYHFLNIGLKLPISTGTDWFIYDFSRVYARVPESLTIKSWLDALKAGRNSVTNGPLLSLKADGNAIGDTIRLDKPKRLKIVAEGVGRHDFQKLQLVHNGKVIHTETTMPGNRRHRAQFEREVLVDGPGWLALRIDSDAKNELGQQLFAHTSPIYVEMDGRRALEVESARALIRQLEEGRDDIRARGKFSTDAAREKVLEQYDEAIRQLAARIKR